MKKYLFLVSWIALIAYLLFTATHGLFLPDEGYILNSGMKILNGQIPYRDFDFVYTPLTAFLSSVAFIFWGQSVLAERILSFIISLATTICLYKISSSQLKNRWLSMVVVSVYVSWGPGHINFLNPAMIAVDLGIITAYAWMQKAKTFYLSIGALTIFTILAKQNFGAALFLAILIALLVQRKNMGEGQSKNIVIGLGITGGFFMLYLIATSSFIPFISGILTYTIRLFIGQGSLNTPIDIGSGITAPFKVLAYLSPLLISIFCFIRTHSTKMILFPLIATAYYLAGIRPETDYIHLVPLLAISSLALIPLLREKTVVRRIALFISILLAVTGIYTSLNFPYYRWKPQLLTQKTFVSSERVMIWTDETTAKDLSTLKEFVDGNVTKKEKIYLNYYAPMVYFFLNRPNPTRFDYPGLPIDLEGQLLSSLEAQKVDYILTHPLAGIGINNTQSYISKHYSLKKRLYGYEVWRRL